MNSTNNVVLTTTEGLATGLQVDHVFNMVVVTYPIKISSKGVFEKLFGDKTNGYVEAMNLLAKQAPNEANAIIGIKTTTATQQFSDGVYLYLTMTGTPVRYSDVSGG